MDEMRRQVEDIFQQAVDLRGAPRAELLDRLCGSRADLRAEVQKLLHVWDAGVETFLSTPALAGSAAASDDQEPLPLRIGHYEIVGRIGEGGMGTVYEARQDSPRRTVALKVIRPGLTSSQVVRRFRQEAEVLGQLQHPGIAHIYEAGIAEIHTRTGQTVSQPFFAMELVRGQPLTTYATQRKLNIRERLALVALVADAVQHAHQKGVIHRDLKPANILVVEDRTAPSGLDAAKSASSTQGLGPLPKILDFGVARMTDQDMQTLTLQTHAGQIIGTVPYMSPEQVTGDSRQLDTRSDVYALGVILYELLAGKLPLDVRNLSIPEAARVVREEEPSRLSSVNTSLRGDVETIVAKALAKEKERRYASAAELAADIRHYLRDEPIVARPASTWYQAIKFAKRHQALAWSLACTIALLVGGITISLTLYFQARTAREAEKTQRELAQRNALQAQQNAEQAQREADHARHEAARATMVSQFVLQDMLRSADPNADGYQVKMVDVLSRAAEAAGTRFAKEPDLEGQARATLGYTFSGLGLRREACEQLKRAITLLEKTRGRNHPDTIDAMSGLATAVSGMGNSAEATPIFEEALARGEKTLGPDSTIRIKIMTGLGDALQIQGKYSRAEPLLRDAAAAMAKKGGADDEQTLVTRHTLAACIFAQNRVSEAADIDLDVLARARKSLATGHPLTVAVMNNVINSLVQLKRYEEAAPIARELVAAATQRLPPEHPLHAYAAITCGNVLMRMGKYDEAEPYMTRSVEMFKQRLGEDRFETERAEGLMRDLYDRWGKRDKAERWARAAAKSRLRIAGPGELPSVIKATREFQSRLTADGRNEALADLLSDFARDAETFVPPGARNRARYLGNIGRVLSETGAPAKAEPILKKAFESLASAGDPVEDRKLVVAALVKVCRRLDRNTEAAEWEAKMNPPPASAPHSSKN